jgi:hypothetical protein
MFYEFVNIGKLSTDCFIVVDLSEIFLAFERILYALNSTNELFDSCAQIEGDGFWGLRGIIGTDT